MASDFEAHALPLVTFQPPPPLSFAQCVAAKKGKQEYVITEETVVEYIEKCEKAQGDMHLDLCVSSQEARHGGFGRDPAAAAPKSNSCTNAMCRHPGTYSFTSTNLLA